MKALKEHIRLPYYFGGLILILLLFKLPGVATQFSPFECPKCTVGAPVVTWLGAGYFAGLLTFIFCEPRFFSRTIASIGILYAIVLGSFLLWYSPDFCYICFFSHLLHVAIWGYFLIFPQKGFKLSHTVATHFIYAVQIGLLTTLVYFGIDKATYNMGVKQVEERPAFSFTTLGGKKVSSDALQEYRYVILQFVLPNCHYCKQQLPVLNEIMEGWKNGKIGVFNIVANRRGKDSSMIEEEVHSLAPNIPIAIDTGFVIGRKFHIRSFPTIVILDSNGRIVDTLIGRPPNLKQELGRTLKKEG